MQALLEEIAGSDLSNEIDDAGRARAQLGFCFQQPLRVTGDSINELLVGRRDDFLQLGLTGTVDQFERSSQLRGTTAKSFGGSPSHQLKHGG